MQLLDRPPELVCPECRVVRRAGETCEVCGVERAEVFADAVQASLSPRAAALMTREIRLFYALLGTFPSMLFLTGILSLVTAWPAGLVMLVLGLPATGLMWTAFTGRKDGLVPFLRVRAVPRRLEAWRIRSRGRLLPAAPVDPSRVRTGRIDAPPAQVVARLEVWFLPRGRVPFAWQATSEGFSILLDDGTPVAVVPGLLRIEVPQGHARRVHRRAAGKQGPRAHVVVVELVGQQRVRLDAELQPAPEGLGYRDQARRFVTRGLATLQLLPEEPPGQRLLPPRPTVA